MRISLLLTTIIVISSCTDEVKRAEIIPGKTGIAEALEILNNPKYVVESSLYDKSQYYSWDNIGLLVRNEKVISIQRSPAQAEESLQYWRHLSRNEVSTFTQLRTSPAEKIWSLSLPTKNMNIIYNEHNGKVIRIHWYQDGKI